MTHLRQRMLADLQRSSLSARTQERSVRAGRQRAEHDHKSPDRITEAERRDDCLSLQHVKHYSRRARTIALGGSQFFYAHTLRREWTTLTFVRAPREKPRPVIRSREAVRTMLAHLPRLRSRVCRTTISSGGLRRQEGPHLPGPAIDAARLGRPIRHGQGGKARYGPLPQRPRQLLRAAWLTQRHPVWLCPAPGRGGTGLATATPPLPRASGPEAFRAARKASGIPKRASVPTRRHAWATPLRAAGVHLRLRPAPLGHHSPATTALDTPLTRTAPEMAAPALNRLMADRSGARWRRSSASTARSPGPSSRSRGRPAIAGRWRPSHPVGPKRVAARSPRVTLATTLNLATTPVRTAPGPHANMARLMRSCPDNRRGAGPAPPAW